MSKKYLVLLAVLIVATVGGYALWQSTITVEERVGQRAVERWHALMAGDFKKAYSYLGPGYRSATPYTIYEARLRSVVVEWKQVDIKLVKCQPELCSVDVDVDYRPTVKDFKTYQLQSRLNEKWVKVDNQWWYVP